MGKESVNILQILQYVMQITDGLINWCLSSIK